MIKSIYNKCLEIIYPNKCICCQNNTIDSYNQLCYLCWQGLEFINDSYCHKCGYPLESEAMQILNKCYYCIKYTQSYSLIRSIIRYKNTGKKLVHNFKFFNKSYVLQYLMQNITPDTQEIINRDSIDYILYVPTGYLDHLQRKCDHILLMAKTIAQMNNKQILHNVLKSKVKTTKTKFMDFLSRHENVKNKFYISNGHMVKNKNILLIDDVITTGATINYCSKLLANYGANKIYVFSIARTILANT